MDVATFAAVMGNSVPLARYQALLPAWNAALLAAGCTTAPRVAMLVGQVGHESVGLKYMQEIWGPTPTQLTYQGRMGNTQPGDGRMFAGHGPLQITGHDNHLAVSKWAFSKGYVPTPTYFVDHPDELAGDQYGFMGVVWYWTVARAALNSYADAGQIEAATRAVNGGVNGLADRTARWKRALTFGDRLLPTPAVEWFALEPTLPVLQEGDGYPPAPPPDPTPVVPPSATTGHATWVPRWLLDLFSGWRAA